jgi:hypothetical protein
MFPIRIAQLASLPQRQTPLLLPASSHVEVRFEVVVPNSWQVPSSLPPSELREGDSTMIVHDSVAGHALRLDRIVDLPATRIEAGDAYARFARFTQDADATIEREIALSK